LFGLLKHTWEVVDSTVLKEWRWFIMNGYKYNSLIYTTIEILKLMPGCDKFIHSLRD